jgi:hypothetical protein
MRIGGETAINRIRIAAIQSFKVGLGPSNGAHNHFFIYLHDTRPRAVLMSQVVVTLHSEIRYSASV